MRRSCFLVVLLTLVLAAWTLPAGAEVPRLLSYQGVLHDSGGQPVTGTPNMVFSIYAADTGGTALWSESHASVAVADGLYSVVLGGSTALDLDLDQPLWLGVAVGADAEMTPRTRITPAPQALWASGVSWQGVAGKPANVVHVAKTGGDFASIQAAIDSLPEPGEAGLVYLVLVAPGTYAERVALQSNVIVRGAGRKATIIQAAGGPGQDAASAVVNLSAGGELRNVTVKSQSEGEYYGIGVFMWSEATAWVRQVDIEVTGSTEADGVFQAALTGSLTLEDVAVAASSTGDGYCMQLVGAESWVSHCKCQLEVGEGDGEAVGIVCLATLASLDDVEVDVSTGTTDHYVAGAELVALGSNPFLVRDLKVAISAPGNDSETYGVIIRGGAGPIRVFDVEVEAAGKGDTIALWSENPGMVLDGAGLKVTSGAVRYGMLLHEWTSASGLDIEISGETPTPGSELVGIRVTSESSGGRMADLDIRVSCDGCSLARGIEIVNSPDTVVEGGKIWAYGGTETNGVNTLGSAASLSGLDITASAGSDPSHNCWAIETGQNPAEAANTYKVVLRSSRLEASCEGCKGAIGLRNNGAGDYVQAEGCSIWVHDAQDNYGMYSYRTATRLKACDIRVDGEGANNYGIKAMGHSSYAEDSQPDLVQSSVIRTVGVGLWAESYDQIRVMGSEIVGQVGGAKSDDNTTIFLRDGILATGSSYVVSETGTGDVQCLDVYDQDWTTLQSCSSGGP